MTLGDILKKYREENHISMDEFSRRSTLSKGYISMLENNINPRSSKPIAPTLPTIKKIANGMNTEIDIILKLLNDGQELLAENIITMSEYEDIKKYRSLDSYGKQLIDLVLEEEYKRCITQAAVLNHNQADISDQLPISAAMKKIGQDIQSLTEDTPNMLIMKEIGEEAFKKGGKTKDKQKKK